MFFLLGLFCLLALPQPAQGHSIMQEECRERRLPPNPVGEAAGAFLDAVCQSDAAVHRQFVQDWIAPSLLERLSADDLVAMFSMLHTDIGDAEIMTVDMSSPYEGVFGFADRQGVRMNLDLQVERDAPNRIAGFGIDEHRPEVLFEDLDALHDHLAEEAKAETFSGVVLIAQDGSPIFEQAYGWANKAEERPNTLDTRFNLGSLNKLFTSVAILQLAEQDKLDLDAPIGTYLDGFPNNIANRVTVRHLLQHRSGWGGYFGHQAYRNNRRNLLTLDDYMAFIRELPLDFEPGTSEQYSNTGFEVLGAIIEAVSGESYYDYVKAHIYDPAGMTSAGSFTHDADNLATGYAQQDTPGYATTNHGWIPPRGTAAGGGYATVGDLLRFQRVLMNDELLPPSYTNLLLSRFESMDDTPRGGAFGFAGGAPGVNTVWEMDLAAGYSVIVFTNFDPPTAQRLGPAIMDMVRDD